METDTDLNRKKIDAAKKLDKKIGDKLINRVYIHSPEAFY